MKLVFFVLKNITNSGSFQRLGGIDEVEMERVVVGSYIIEFVSCFLQKDPIYSARILVYDGQVRLQDADFTIHPRSP